MAEEDFKYDPEADEDTRKYRLPYAICKSRGIAIQDWWTPRDAWNALKGIGINPDDEYSKHYEELARKKKQDSVERSKNRKKAKVAQLKNPDHNPDKNYKHQDGYIAGAKKDAPMDFSKADSGNVNPYYGKAKGYGHNCQTCVATYYARRMGYDVRALPNLNNRNIFALSAETSLAYVNADGKHPEHIYKQRGERSTLFLEKNIKQGEIYSVEFNFESRKCGHIITVERDENGSIRLYDPQSNKLTSNKDIQSYFADKRNISIMQLSGCTIDEKFCDSIMKKK